MFSAERKPLELPSGWIAADEVDVLLHILELLGVNVYADPGEEADDLIASFVKAHEDDVHVVVSSDKDFFQLLTNPRVVQYRPGASGQRLVDAEAAEAYWATLNRGNHPPVPCAHVRMFKSLCGDASDTIVGVPRLRKRTAAAVAGYADVDCIAAAGWPGFSELEKQRAQELLDRLKLNWQLVGLIDTLPVEPLRRVEPNAGLAAVVLKHLNICLDTTFLVPGASRMSVADAPAKVVKLDDNWLDAL
jgi:5'-3' exonuclease